MIKGALQRLGLSGVVVPETTTLPQCKTLYYYTFMCTYPSLFPGRHISGQIAQGNTIKSSTPERLALSVACIMYSVCLLAIHWVGFPNVWRALLTVAHCLSTFGFVILSVLFITYGTVHSVHVHRQHRKSYQEPTAGSQKQQLAKTKTLKDHSSGPSHPPLSLLPAPTLALLLALRPPSSLYISRISTFPTLTTASFSAAQRSSRTCCGVA